MRKTCKEGEPCCSLPAPKANDFGQLALALAEACVGTSTSVFGGSHSAM